MRRRVTLMVAILIVGAVLPMAAQSMAYDKGKTVEIMRQNLAAFRPPGGAVESGDYAAAGLSFLKLAEGSMMLTSMTPPRGDKAEWDRIHTALAKAAVAGAAGRTCRWRPPRRCLPRLRQLFPPEGLGPDQALDLPVPHAPRADIRRVDPP